MDEIVRMSEKWHTVERSMYHVLLGSGAYVLANSASRGARKNENSVSSRALKTSAGAIVFFPAFMVFSFALESLN